LTQQIKVLKSEAFGRWVDGLRDRRAAARIAIRVDRLAAGNPGDVKPVGDGISEMRINYGPGYRVYFQRSGDIVAILLCGGDKSTQQRDIENAKRIAKEWQQHG
jgi:putative addiction module killer protein